MKNTIIALAASAIALGSVNAQTSFSGLVDTTGTTYSPNFEIIPQAEFGNVSSVAVNPGTIFFANAIDINDVLIEIGQTANVVDVIFNFDSAGGVVTGGTQIGNFDLPTFNGVNYTADGVFDFSNLRLAAAPSTADQTDASVLSFSGSGLVNSVTFASLSGESYLAFSGVAVPEPSSALLLGLGAFGLLGRRKR